MVSNRIDVLKKRYGGKSDGQIGIYKHVKHVLHVLNPVITLWSLNSVLSKRVDKRSTKSKQTASFQIFNKKLSKTAGFTAESDI